MGAMRPDEAAAIMLYTQETCLYHLLNEALRGHDAADLAPFLPFLKLLLTALHRLPLVQTQVFRGVKLDLSSIYNQVVGRVFTWWSFSSTTRNRAVLTRNPLFLGSSGPRTLFCIHAVGVDIARFSSTPSEAEVLLLPGTRLRIEREGEYTEEDLCKFRASVVVGKHKREGTEQRGVAAAIRSPAAVNDMCAARWRGFFAAATESGADIHALEAELVNLSAAAPMSIAATDTAGVSTSEESAGDGVAGGRGHGELLVCGLEEPLIDFPHPGWTAVEGIPVLSASPCKKDFKRMREGRPRWR